MSLCKNYIFDALESLHGFASKILLGVPSVGSYQICKYVDAISVFIWVMGKFAYFLAQSFSH